MGRFFRSTAVVIACFLPSLALAAPAGGSVEPQYIPDKYVIQLKPTANTANHLSWVNDLHARSMRKRALLPELQGLERNFSITNFKAYSGEFDAATVASIKASPDVLLVEKDQMFYPTEMQHFDKRAIYSRPYAPWGQQMISQRPKYSGLTAYSDDTAGQGTWTYIIDSGINVGHQDFQGRAQNAWTGYPNKPNTDTQGHGTHCAGIAGARFFGVSEKTWLVGVKVFDDGGAAYSLILDGFAWAVNDIKYNNRVGRSVLSMSLGGGFSQTFNDAIKAAYNDGILSVVAAGNNGADAGGTSPASAAEAVTVGAVDKDYNYAGYSNWGGAVDIFAMGTEVFSTFIGSNTATATLTGTSMACPHVAGLAVYFIALFNKPLTPKDIVNSLTYCASYDAIKGLPYFTLNALAYNCSNK